MISTADQSTETVPKLMKRFVWNSRFFAKRVSPWIVEENPEFYRLGAFVWVQEGDEIGKLAEIEGTPLPDDATIIHEVGKGVEIAPGRERLIAKCGGKVEIINHVISIVPWETITATGARETHGTPIIKAVYVEGSLTGEYDLRSKAAITIEEGIEGVSLLSASDIVIALDVNGQERSILTANGQVVARSCSHSTIIAGGDIRILNAAICSYIQTRAYLDISGGTIQGGSIFARNGVRAEVIGGELTHGTVIRVGLHPDTMLLMSGKELEMKSKMDSISKIRKTVTPMMSDVMALSDEHRNRATALLSQAEIIELEIKDLKSDLEGFLNEHRPQHTPVVKVEKRIYAGTTISVNDYSTCLPETLEGPVTIQLAELNGKTVLVAKFRERDEIIALPTTRSTQE